MVDRPDEIAQAGGVLGQRRSRSADAAWHDELDRIRAMTVRERIALALALGEELEALFPSVVVDD